MLGRIVCVKILFLLPKKVCSLLDHSTVKQVGEDTLWWVSSKRGFFAVRLFYSVLVHSDGSNFP
jgi:hypothetical protein